MPSFSTMLESILGLLFPDRCAGCGKAGQLFCAQCRRQLVPYTGSIRAIPAVDAVQIAYVYGGPLRASIHQLKYRRRRRVAAPLGELLGTFAKDHAASIDGLVPVPMHASRMAERGFNQAEEIARITGAAAGIPCLSDGLRRTRATGQQARLNAGERQENMRGAFVWLASEPPPRRLIIVDDVLTTGATMSACALALRAAGCQEVYGLALARSRPDFA